MVISQGGQLIKPKENCIRALILTFLFIFPYNYLISSFFSQEKQIKSMKTGGKSKKVAVSAITVHLLIRIWLY